MRIQSGGASFGALRSISTSEKTAPLPLDSVIQGDCVDLMNSLPPRSIDLVFADPPYNLQLEGTLKRPDDSLVDAVDDEWDKFDSMTDYDNFTRSWLLAVRRLMKPQASLWVIGSYHNIFRLGAILQDLGFWIINDIIWRKANPMPNFRGRRFTNAHETLIWAVRDSKVNQYTFNYESLKAGNEDVQMRSDWFFPICSGVERLKDDKGDKVHPTQKPLALLNRILTASSKPGDVVLDPFFGTGTTGVAAKTLGRHYIGLERDAGYIAQTVKRLEKTTSFSAPLIEPVTSKRTAARVAFNALLEAGMINVGEELVDEKGRFRAKVRADGALISGEHVGSIHKVAAKLLQRESCNGWDFWYNKSSGGLASIDDLRQEYRRRYPLAS